MLWLRRAKTWAEVCPAVVGLLGWPVFVRSNHVNKAVSDAYRSIKLSLSDKFSFSWTD